MMEISHKNQRKAKHYYTTYVQFKAFDKQYLFKDSQ